MATVRQLRRPPISEALVDLRVDGRPDVDPAEFHKAKPRLSPGFPGVEERREATTSIGLGPGRVPHVVHEDKGLRGLFFKSSDGKRIAQFRTDGFTLNRLKPYQSWEELLTVWREVWPIYVAVSQPLRVVRLGVRCINHFFLPGPASEISRHLPYAPSIDVGAQAEMTSFLVRTTCERSGAAGHVVLGAEPAPDRAGLDVLLDVDAFRTVDLRPDSPEVEALLGGLRDFKNDLFFGNLSDEALRRFE